MKNSVFWNSFIYEESLFISFRAFMPSLRVLKTSQESENIIRIASVRREIKVVSILLAIKVTFILGSVSNLGLN